MGRRPDEREALAVLCAAPAEAEAVRRGGLDAEVVGVGKIASALGAVRRLYQQRPERVLLIGLAGAFRASGLAVGDVCVVGRSVLADEGVAGEGGVYLDAHVDLGFEVGGPWAADAELSRCLPVSLPRVVAATVSTCAGNDSLDMERSARTGAAVETMESAAIAAVCAELGVRWCELRVVSNYCGDRSRSGWDLQGALGIVSRVVGELAEDGVLSSLETA